VDLWDLQQVLLVVLLMAALRVLSVVLLALLEQGQPTAKLRLQSVVPELLLE
jgi:cell shape-determining protein MreD